MEKIVIELGSDDYYARYKHAKERAEWELGDSSWAGVIVGAFLFPDEEGLEREKE